MAALSNSRRGVIQGPVLSRGLLLAGCAIAQCGPLATRHPVAVACLLAGNRPRPLLTRFAALVSVISRPFSPTLAVLQLIAPFLAWRWARSAIRRLRSIFSLWQFLVEQAKKSPSPILIAREKISSPPFL
jgi:hypothetical protein